MAIVFTYEDVIPPIVENTIMRKMYMDGVFRVYTIAPAEGYVLHDSTYDYPDIDGNLVIGYRRSEGTCAANYDFDANPREFYAVPENEVPGDQIFENGGSAEIM